MTAIIRYKIPYVMNGKFFFVLSFALGIDVYLRCGLGSSTLLSIGAIDLVSGELLCIEINHAFPPDLNPPVKGLPNKATLNNYSSFIPPVVLTDNASDISILYCTSTDDASNPLCQSTFSDNIIVKDHFLQKRSLLILLLHLHRIIVSN